MSAEPPSSPPVAWGWEPGVLLPSAGPGLGWGLGLLGGLFCAVGCGWALWRLAASWGGGGREEVGIGRLAAVGLILCAGPLVAGWIVLLGLWVDVPLRFATPWLVGLAGFAAVYLLRGKSAAAVAATNKPGWPGARQPALMVVMALAGMISALLGLTLPTGDYDGLVIWSYRTRVLVAEGVFYTGSFLDGLRLIPMMGHPYLLPVAEALWCVGGGAGFSWAGQRAAHICLILGWLALSWSAAGLLRYPAEQRWIVAAALGGLPCTVFGPWMESAREPLIGVMLGVSTLFLAVWARCPGWPGGLLLAGACAVLAQQIKVEGAPGLAGMMAAAVWFWLLEPRGSQARRLRWSALWRTAVLVGAVALPWALMRTTLPRTDYGYDLTIGIDLSITTRTRALLQTLRLTFQEFFARPEFYGLAVPLALAIGAGAIRRQGLCGDWRRWAAAPALLLPAGLIFVSVAAVYVVRQDYLPPERNFSFSRRMFALMPALLVALLAIPQFLAKPPAAASACHDPSNRKDQTDDFPRKE